MNRNTFPKWSPEWMENTPTEVLDRALLEAQDHCSRLARMNTTEARTAYWKWAKRETQIEAELETRELTKAA